MDKRTLKMLIIELKDSGRTYQEISEILKIEHSIIMTRQAVYGMYKRATSNEEINKSKELMLLTNDIINYTALGLNYKEIKNRIAQRKIDVKLADIKRIVVENEAHIKSVELNNIRKASNLLKDGLDFEEIRMKLHFKGELPSKKVTNIIIEKATEIMIFEAITEILANVLSTTDNKDIIKSISAKFNIDITSRDLSKILNR